MIVLNNKRHSNIYSQIYNVGSTTVKEMKSIYPELSSTTIRRDLVLMVRQGVLSRVARKGAIVFYIRSVD